MRVVSCFAFAMLALASCATFAETVPYALPDGAPTAQISLARGNMLARREGRLYIAAPDGMTRAALAPVGTSGYNTPFKIEAGSKLIFEIETANVYKSSPVETDPTTSDCSEYYSFTPQAGGSYKVTLQENDSACATVIVQDLVTGKAPPDLKHELAL